jgi:hypothetical protein
VKAPFNPLLNHSGKHDDEKPSAGDVEEEFRFHIELQAQEYERQGRTREEALALAASRFGNVAQIKAQCVRIRERNSRRMMAMKLLFAVTFLLGVIVRVFGSGFTVIRVGDVLMMIGVLGGLLLYLKSTGASWLNPAPETFSLGLDKPGDVMPLSFDEKGRSPFERVRSDN